MEIHGFHSPPNTQLTASPAFGSPLLFGKVYTAPEISCNKTEIFVLNRTRIHSFGLFR